MTLHPVLIGGRWRKAASFRSFSAFDPSLGEKLEDEYPVSDWSDCDEALDAAKEAADRLRATPFVVNGQKIWTSSAHYADMMFLL